MACLERPPPTEICSIQSLNSRLESEYQIGNDLSSVGVTRAKDSIVCFAAWSIIGELAPSFPHIVWWVANDRRAELPKLCMPRIFLRVLLVVDMVTHLCDVCGETYLEGVEAPSPIDHFPLFEI